MNKEKGFVSIIVAAVLMILLSLVTIGFSQLMQREQRQALDRQLSTQAFYAAETAVSDVNKKLLEGTLTPEEKTDCDVSGVWNDGVIDSSKPEVSYTCLQYDQSPPDLLFTDTINTSSSKVFPVESSAAISKVTFEWVGENNSTSLDASSLSCAAAGSAVSLPTSFGSGTIPMLRLDLIEVPGAVTRQGLIDRTASFYLYPKNCGSTTADFASYVGANSGRVIEVNCSASGCNFEITGLNSTKYVARVKGVYGNVGSLRVTAVDSSDDPLELINAQTLVDSTGKANDVVRRIEVRIASAPNYRWPEAVIETSNGVCKLLQIAPPNTVANSDCY